MPQKGIKDVISIWAPKEASLYFDRVFPFDFSHSLMHHVGIAPEENPNGIPFENGAWNPDILKSLIPDHDNPPKLYLEYSALMTLMNVAIDLTKSPDNIEYWENIWIETERFCKLFGIDSKILRKNPKKSVDILAGRIASLIESAGFRNAPTWISRDFRMVPGDGPESSFDSKNDFCVTLAGLNLVDVSEVSWDKIVEFRKDKKSKASLRDLRLFFTENFSDKDPSYVIDKLESLVYHQENTIKLWNMETAQKSMSAIFSNKSVITSSMASLATLIAGAPLAVAATSAAVISLGSCALEFSKVYIDSKKTWIDSPTRYLTDIKKLTK